MEAAVADIWKDYHSKGSNPEEQNRILGKLLSQGRLSKNPKGNWIVLSDRDSGIIFNPSFTDGITLFFVYEEDVINFIKEKQSRITKNFSCFRLCDGKCSQN